MLLIFLYLLAVVNESEAAAKNFFELNFEEEFPRSLEQSPWSNTHARDFEEFENGGVVLNEGYILKEDHDETKLSKRDDSETVVTSIRSSPRCVKKKNNAVVRSSPPSFRIPVKEMQNLVSGHLGHRMELFCPHRKGCPRASVSWTKDGEMVSRRGRKSGLSTIRMKQNGDLIIEDNRKEDDGNYTCIISNNLGTIHHSIMVKSVPRVVAMEPKILTNQPGNHTVVVGGNITLLCQLTVEDELSTHFVGWYKHYQVDGEWIDPDTGTLAVHHLQDSYSSPPPEDDQKLPLTNLTMSDTGWYSCRISNQYGRLFRSGYVQVVEELNPQASISHYTYLSIGIGGAVGLCLCCVVFRMFFKYRKEREQKTMAIKTAQCVVRWTKKIIVERSMRDIDEDEILCPRVWMEKILVQGSEMMDNKKVETYEIQLDADWEFPRELLELGEELGQGAFGRVVGATAHHCKVKLNQEESRCQLLVSDDATAPVNVAVKMLKEDHSEEEIIDLVKEIEIMKAVGGHINIVNLLGACTQPSGQPLLAIMEFAEFGNLRDHLRWRKGGHCGQAVSLREMLSIGWQVARGMQFLSGRKCVHRDLAARNVLVAKDGVVKIADFGLARDTQESDYYRKTGEGKLPVLWMSPESLFAGLSTTMSDIWSYGVLLWEIVTWGERPYTGVPTEAVLDLVKDGYTMACPPHCPPELYVLMRSCWHMEPSIRPSWTCLVEALLKLYDQTLPGVYLELAPPAIPTPPSSPESVSTISCTSLLAPPPPYSPGYMPGISPISHLASPSPPPPPPLCSHVTVLRSMSEESGYSSSRECGQAQPYYNL